MWYGLIITLSAVLFSGAFFLPNALGWGAMCGVMLLWYPLVCMRRNVFHHREQAIRFHFGVGFVWGSLIIFPLFYWIFDVIIRFSWISPWLGFVLYSMLCCYVALTIGLWHGAIAFLCWHVCSLVLRLLVCMVVTIGYFVWLGQWGLFVLASGDGYPLLNPLIPLCAYRPFVRLVCLVSSMVVGPNYFDGELKLLDEIGFIAPSVSMITADPSILGQQVYHAVTDFVAKGGAQKLVICAPESFFPHTLNDKQETVNLWANALLNNKKFIVGAHVERDGRVFQGAFLLEDRPIIQDYVKKHRVPFVEYIPPFWNFLDLKQGILKESTRCFSSRKNTHGNKIFCITKNFSFIPQLCSEFIFSHSTKCFRKKISNEQPPIILWLVNDRWFIPSFRKTLQLAGCLRAAWIGLPIVYVGHMMGENKSTGWRL